MVFGVVWVGHSSPWNFPTWIKSNCIESPRPSLEQWWWELVEASPWVWLGFAANSPGLNSGWKHHGFVDIRAGCFYGGGAFGGLRPSNSYDKNMYIFPAFSGFNPYEPFINHHDPLIIHAWVIYGDVTWRVIPSLVSVVISHEYAMNGRCPATRVRKLTITIVANWLLNGMILQVTSPETHIFAQERIVTPSIFQGRTC